MKSFLIAKHRPLLAMLLLSGCATFNATRVQVDARVNRESPLAAQPFALRVFVEEDTVIGSAASREQLKLALERKLTGLGYRILQRCDAPCPVARVHYAANKAYTTSETTLLPTYGIIGAYPNRVFGITGYHPISRPVTRYRDELAITAFDENAGWVWDTRAAVEQGDRTLSPYPELYGIAEGFLAQSESKTIAVPKAAK